MNNLIGYKVVRKRTLQSATRNIGSIKYKTNDWVYPEKDCGPLCVFKDKKNAINFMGESFGDFYSIYECLYEPSKEKYVYYKKIIQGGLSILPTGTALANRVKLTKKEKI